MTEHKPPEDEPPIQPAVRVPSAWLTSFENHVEAKQVAELEADRDLLDRLMWGGYAGLEYEIFAERLARYGLAVMTAWCQSGAVFRKCADKGWAVGDPVRIPGDDAAELANLTVAVALAKFRETVLIPNIWDHRKGASLKSFFIGQCLLRFLNEYRTWRREQRRSVGLLADPADSDRLAGSYLDPVVEVISHERMNELLMEATRDPLNQQILIYEASGHSDQEIAELTGLDLSAVKSRLYRVRKNMRMRRAKSA